MKRFPIILALVGAGIGGLSHLMESRIKRVVTYDKGLNAVRDRAIMIGPVRGALGAISREEIREVLIKVEPRWRFPKINYVLHAMRLWGTAAKFGDDHFNPFSNGTPSGERMLDLIRDCREAERAGVEPCMFLYRNRDGVEVQYEADGGGVAHRDQYLKVMGELGMRSSCPVYLLDGSQATLGDLVRYSLHKFEIEQELEFSAVAFARWLPPNKSWINRHGERYDFDAMALAILGRTPGRSSCSGIHTLYALANILRIHQDYGIVSVATNEKIRRRFLDTSSLLRRNQHADGLWLGRWYESAEPSAESWEFQAVVATGHHLEWISFVPEELRPPRDAVKKAAKALSRLVRDQTVRTVSGSYPAFSHAARGLALIENVDAASILEESVASGPAAGR
jgi:hypothetical protein